MDSCNAFQEFGLITLPLMRPILFFMAVMTTIGVFNMLATLAAWPPVIIFFIFRKQFIGAIMAGALKGG